MEKITDYLSTLIPAAPDLAISFTFVALCIAFIVAVFNKADHMMLRIAHRKKDNSRRDAKRVFTNKQKSQVSKACNDRCEGTGLFFRCRYRGTDLHGDHWFPHSKGGATSMTNLVMLCPACNRRKSDHIPSRLQTVALNRRRKRGRDYDGDLPSPVGEWLPRGYINTAVLEKQRSSLRPSF